MMSANKINIRKEILAKKLKEIKQASALKNLHIQNERKRVILAKIAHYKKTNNPRKLDIYQRKLDDVSKAIAKLKSSESK